MFKKSCLKEKFQEMFEYFGDYKNTNGATLLTNLEQYIENSKRDNSPPPSWIKIQVTCPKCNNERETSFNSFKNNSTKLCQSCSQSVSGSLKMDVNYYKEKIRERYGSEFDLIKSTESCNLKEKVVIRHNSEKCGFHMFELILGGFLYGRGSDCPVCSGRKMNTKTYKERIKEIHGDEFSIMSEYTTGKKKILVRHNSERCKNHTWSMRASALIHNNSGCPKCASSKGEQIIMDYLKEKAIGFSTQYTFSDLRDKRLLKFDFAIHDENNALKCLVEYDGEYHYVLSRYRDAKERLEGTQRRDRLKNDYCKANNIPLIRIPYWEKDNIEQILDRELEILLK